MNTLLQIKSSLFGDNGNSSNLSNEFVQSWLAKHTNGKVVVRDLAEEAVPHLNAAQVSAFFTPAEERNELQQSFVDYSDLLIDELKKADAIVIGVPLYNFGIPSTLKAYFDQLARAGVTFQYSETGPVGLLADKPVHIIAARGGFHMGKTSDSQTAYLNTFLNFLGLKSIHYIYAEGLNLTAEKAQSLSNARDKIEQASAA
ncbi:MAG: NAD(P)H-dependent oxidoreductase [Pseudomonadota bacterium]